MKKKIYFITLKHNYHALKLSETLKQDINNRFLHSRIYSFEEKEIDQEINSYENIEKIKNFDVRHIYFIVFYEVPLAETGTLKTVSNNLNGKINSIGGGNFFIFNFFRFFFSLDNIIYFMIHENDETFKMQYDYNDKIVGSRANVKIFHEKEKNNFINHLDALINE